MAFLGDVEFKDGRSPTQTTALVLQHCLGRGKQVEQVEEFFARLSISPKAFFKDIDADWLARPFIGQHAFKIVQTAGYEGTENDFWLAVTGRDAPYFIKKSSVKLAARGSAKRAGELKKAASVKRKKTG